MIVRFFLFSLIVGAFAWLARAIVERTRHLEKRQLESGLLVLENEGRTLALARRRINRVNFKD